jgi:hypothetical protein
MKVTAAASCGLGYLVIACGAIAPVRRSVLVNRWVVCADSGTQACRIFESAGSLTRNDIWLRASHGVNAADSLRRLMIMRQSSFLWVVAAPYQYFQSVAFAVTRWLAPQPYRALFLRGTGSSPRYRCKRLLGRW